MVAAVFGPIPDGESIEGESETELEHAVIDSIVQSIHTLAVFQVE
jgi:hypothetical protein